MDVTVTELRARLIDWLERARGGAEVVITDDGLPVARLVGLNSTPAGGVIGPAASPRRPVASGRSRPRRPLSDLMCDHRR